MEMRFQKSNGIKKILSLQAKRSSSWKFFGNSILRNEYLSASGKFNYNLVDKSSNTLSPSIFAYWLFSLNDTKIIAMEDFQQSLNNSCFREIKCKMSAFYKLQ